MLNDSEKYVLILLLSPKSTSNTSPCYAITLAMLTKSLSECKIWKGGGKDFFPKSVSLGLVDILPT